MAVINLDNGTGVGDETEKAPPLVAGSPPSLGDVSLIRESAPKAEVTVNTRVHPGWPRTSRALDLFGAIAMLIVLLPVMVLLSIATAITTSGSPIFAHPRVGRGKRIFKCYKFRTMYVDADARLLKLLEENPSMKREWEADHKLKDDPRVTAFGRFMRVTSLDELPQLLNVIKGEMSLVGPRPIVEQELLRYGKYSSSYLALRPGLTGLWQVSGRSATTYRRRVATDHVYALNKCLTLDLRILLATVPAVLKQRGAC